jgi:hypothetical protein
MRPWIFALLVAVLLALSPGRAAAVPLPVTVERGDVVVHAAAGLEDEARALADRAALTLPRIEEDLPDLPRPARIEIRLVHDTADLTSVSPPGRGAPRWAAGVAFPDLGVLALAMGRGGQPHDPGKTLDHELAHLLLGAAVPNAPRWLHEGFSWQHAPEMDFARFETLAGMAWFGNIAPLDELEANFPAEEAPASRAYAQSYDFIRYLANRGRWVDTDDDGDRWPFRAFLRALSQGKSVDDAAREAYGAGIDELYQEWRTDLVQRYLLMPAGVFATLLWVLAALLLVLAWRRRRRQRRTKLAQWEQDEAERHRAATMEALRQQYPDAVISEDDLVDGDDDAERPPPRWMN